LLSSCSPAVIDETKPTDTTLPETEPVETEDPATLHDLPEGLSFNGANFHILSSSENKSQLNTEDAEYTGILMNDVRYDMTDEVMKTLNVSVSEEVVNVYQSTMHLNNMIASGDTSYDCVSFIDRFALECAILNHFIPMQDVNYIDLTKDYWGENLSNLLSINNKNYFAVGSYELSIYERLHCMVINNRLAANYNVTIPFDDVDNGTWTYDKLLSYRGIATTDTDGDGTIDQWTYGGDQRALPVIALISANYKIIDKDDDDKLRLNVYTNTEPFVNILYKVHEAFYTGDLHCVENRTKFEEGNEMIAFAVFKFIDLNYRDMDEDFSVLPVPKYDETQQEYRCRSYDSGFTCIPTTAVDTDKCGAVLECLNSYGYRYLVPAYVETMMQDRLTRDPRSAANIKLIYESRTIELGEAFLFNRFGDTSLESMVKKSNVTSFLSKIQHLVDKDFNELVEKFS